MHRWCEPGDSLTRKRTNTLRVQVITSTLEEIQCVTRPSGVNLTNAVTPTFSCVTGIGATSCATCVNPATSNDCATCNAGSALSNGACLPLGTIVITVPASQADAVGMSRSADGSFLVDSAAAKGTAWAAFSAPVVDSGVYQVQLIIPGNAVCIPRATNVPIVVHHSESSSRSISTVAHMDFGAAGGNATLGSFFFAANSTARTVVDTFNTTGCVAVSAVVLTRVAHQKATMPGCTRQGAANYDLTA
eukprot:COSAG01_NODE_21285_length_909_cov_1.706173_2_plen_246_part_01